MRQKLKFYLFCLLGGFTFLTGCQSKPVDKQEPINVFIFLSPDCPLSQSYVLTINELSKEYKKNDISFYGVFPGKIYTQEQVNDFQKRFHAEFPMSRDTDLILTRKLNATVTPQAFVVNSKNDILYSGRIDNWAYEVSKKRKLITEHDLQNALESIINHTPIRVNKTEAVGCFIEIPGK